MGCWSSGPGRGRTLIRAAAVLVAACVVLLLGRAALWALVGGAVAGLAVAVAGGPLPS